jgi:ribosomal protein S18 acetylase RimI-like enzyme
MSTFTIREARVGDINAIYKIFAETDRLHREAHPERFQTASYPEDIKGFYRTCILKSEADILVAVGQSEMLGALICTVYQSSAAPILTPRTYGCIENITVPKNYRRRKIGTALMEAAKTWAGTKGATSIELTVWEFNQGAASFYHQMGYRTIHHRMIKDLP